MIVKSNMEFIKNMLMYTVYSKSTVYKTYLRIECKNFIIFLYYTLFCYWLHIARFQLIQTQHKKFKFIPWKYENTYTEVLGNLLV